MMQHRMYDAALLRSNSGRVDAAYGLHTGPVSPAYEGCSSVLLRPSETPCTDKKQHVYGAGAIV